MPSRYFFKKVLSKTILAKVLLLVGDTPPGVFYQGFDAFLPDFQYKSECTRLRTFMLSDEHRNGN